MGQIWLWIGFWGMAAGFAAIAALGRATTEESANASVAHSLVPVIAATFYLLMALGQGVVALDGGTRLFYFARYLDWSVTTPLLLLGLAFTALGSLRGRAALVWAMIGADVLMILTGLFAGMSPAGSAAKWAWYLISCGFFVGVLYVLWAPLRALAAARGAEIARPYTRNAAILSVLWLAYPVVFLVGSDGLNIAPAALVLAAFTVLDLLAKVGYGLLATAEHRRRG